MRRSGIGTAEVIMAERLRALQSDDTSWLRRMHFRDLHELRFVGAEAGRRNRDPVVDLPRIRALRHIMRKMKRRFTAAFNRRADVMWILPLAVDLISVWTRWLREIR